MPSWRDLVLVRDHPMRRIFIEKVVVNIGVGASGEKLERAAALLKELTGAEPSRVGGLRGRLRILGLRKASL
jgi:large subunit ribosomal protein L5